MNPSNNFPQIHSQPEQLNLQQQLPQQSQPSHPHNQQHQADFDIPISSSSPKSFPKFASPISPSTQYNNQQHQRNITHISSPTSSVITDPLQVTDLTIQNKALLNEVQLVTFELADSIKRELGVNEKSSPSIASSSSSSSFAPESNSTFPTSSFSANSSGELVSDLATNNVARAQMIVQLETDLDSERRRRKSLEHRLSKIDRNV